MIGLNLKFNDFSSENTSIPMKTDIAQSQRLKIRHFVKSDAEFLLALLNSPRWVEMLGSQDIMTIRNAAQYLKNKILKEYDTRQYGFYLLERKEDQKPIGLCGLTLRDGHSIPDLGFGILPEHEENGYILEASTTILDYIAKTFDIKTIDAFATLPNIPSQHILERLGFSFKEETYHTSFHAWVKHYQLSL